jgi:polysaccharide biosynthesis transport protein
MTTLPTTRPSIPVAPRPAPAMPAPGLGMPALDPVRLLKKYKWVLGAAAAFGIVLGAASHFVLMATFPIYKPYIIYECLPQQGSPDQMGPRIGFEKEFEKFMATQVQVLTSETIIDKTVSDPTLLRDAPNWAAKYSEHGALNTIRASKALRKRLSASIRGDSNFVMVSLWGNDGDETTGLLKLLGRVYESNRQQTGGIEISNRRDTLVRAISASDDQIKALQRDKETLLQNHSIDSLEEQHSSVRQEMNRVSENLVDVRTTLEAMITQRDQLQRELESAAGQFISDSIRKRVEENPTLIQMKHTMNMLESELSGMLMQGLTPQHQSYVKLKSRLDGAKKQYDAEAERLRIEAFNAELDALKTTVASMQAQEAKLQGRIEETSKRAVELTKLLARIRDLELEIGRRSESKSKLSDDLARMEIVTKGPYEARVIRYQDAQLPKGPSFPKITIMVPIGLVLVLGIVGGVIVLLEIVDQRIKGPADVAALPRTRVLGLIPHACEDPQNCERIETVFRDRPSSVLAESFRQVRGQLLKRMAQGGHKTLLVVAATPDSGTTTVALNLAFATAATQQRVLVIDANFRRPSVHRTVGLSEGPGLADVLSGKASLASAVQTVGDITILTAGSPDQRIVERLATEPMNTLLRDAAAAYDMVIIDVAPTLVSGDGLALANRCDATVMVVRAMVDKRGMVARLRNDLGETKADLLGVIVNAARTTAGGYLKGNIESTHKYQTAGA